MPFEPGEPSRLDGRLEALGPQLGLTLSSQDRTHLLAYMAMIQRWTKVYNLTAVRDTDEMFTHHLLDCLAVIAPLRQRCREAGEGALRVLDVGSGAGLPGVILAMLNPAWQVTCVDAVAKKAAFIRQAAAELALPNLHGVHGRVEAAGTFKTPEFDLITSRAFASIHDFTALTGHLLAPQGRWAAMKAKLSAEERAAVPADVEMFHVEQLEVPDLHENRCLVWLRPRLPADQSVRQPRQ
ncbi:MAG: 16S rRNA (guanine(527)-N(7))-methyltransferase RsmG [Burkholderiales bacterium]|nr:16S rRNA (guanine(527)-N(7))-methyltransferase RsmG [Burkholderiales bacterium]